MKRGMGDLPMPRLLPPHYYKPRRTTSLAPTLGRHRAIPLHEHAVQKLGGVQRVTLRRDTPPAGRELRSARTAR